MKWKPTAATAPATPARAAAYAPDAADDPTELRKEIAAENSRCSQQRRRIAELKEKLSHAKQNGHGNGAADDVAVVQSENEMFSRMLDTLQAEMTRQRVQAQRLRGKAKELDERCGTVQRETNRLAGQLQGLQQPSTLPPLGGARDAALPPLNEREPLPAPAPAAAGAVTAAADAVVPTGALDEKLSILRKAVEAGALSETLFEQARQELVAA